MHKWEQKHPKLKKIYDVRSVVCVSTKGKMQKGEQSIEEQKDLCVCSLRCTCNKMMWSVYEIMHVCTLQVKHYTQKSHILKNLTIHGTCNKHIVRFNQCAPTPTTEISIAINA